MSTEREEDTTSTTAVGVAENEVDAESDAAGTPGSWTRGRSPLTLAAVVLVVIAFVCAAVFGLLWFNAKNNNSIAYSKTRQDVLQAAETGAVNLTTLDYRNVQQGLDRWKQSSTGDLYTQLTQGSNTFAQQVAKAKTMSSSTVKQAAVTELDTHAGKASVIMVVDVVVTPSGQKAQQKTLPLTASLASTSSGWKLSSLQQIAVASTGQ